MSKRYFTINSRKFDGRLHRSWQAELLEETADYRLFVGEFSDEIIHSKLGVIRRGTVSYEYYWKNHWYSVFRFHEPDGELRNFYCNVNQPPTISDYVLDYIDLDIDVLVQKDFSFEVLDLDEFEAHSKLFNYSEILKANVRKSLYTLLKLIRSRQFPFDFVQVEN